MSYPIALILDITYVALFYDLLSKGIPALNETIAGVQCFPIGLEKPNWSTKQAANRNTSFIELSFGAQL